MTYTRRLTLALRARGAEEQLIADVLHEAGGLGLDDDALEAELGSPEDYAVALVPERTTRRRVGPLLWGGVVAALAWVVLALLDQPFQWGLRDALGPFLLLPALVLLAVGVVGQFASDYFRRVRA